MTRRESAKKDTCHFSTKVLFWNKWRKNAEGNWKTQVHLENNC